MAGRFTPLDADDPRTVGGYEIRALIGAGGMGRVYLAFSPGGRPLAIKVVRPDYAHDPEFRRRFQREIKAARSVEGLYTAPVVDADSEAKLPWLATAYVPGPSLAQAVAEHGPLPPATVFRLIAGVAEGLAAVHARELVHRDLKPANILLADDGPRVIDFGIAHAASATSATTTGLRIGTPAYMAPEQVRGRSAGPATDVFALGNLAVYAATGRAGFGEGNTEALFYRILHEDPDLDGCPPELREIVRPCLAKDPDDRPGLDWIMKRAGRRTADEALTLTGGWLPDTVATALAAYDTARYSATAVTEKRAPDKPKKTKKLDADKPPATKKTPEKKAPGKKAPEKKPAAKPGSASAPTASSTSDTSGTATDYSWLGLVAIVVAVIVLVIGPGKVLDWLESQAADKPSVSADAGQAPSAEAEAVPSDEETEYTPEPDDEYTPEPDDEYTPEPDEDEYTPEPEPEPEDATPAGCEDAMAGVREYNEATDPGTGELIALEVDLESAAADADDPDVSSAINDLADDMEELRNTLNDIKSADAAGDSWRGDQLREYYDTVGDRMTSDFDRLTDLCP
ncbi:protein kinase [Streptomyces sp. NPDC032940]|uniref:protein kinase domain-containing protein n=1 Tax=Streptomyces sp. NPDC032940 TaxID=3155366 RepID=UPI0033ED7DD4